METIIYNKYGKIKLSENLLGQIARRAIHTSKGQAWLSTSKGKIIDNSISMLVSTQIYAQSVDCKVVNDKLYLTMYIICEFGKSMNNIVSDIIGQLEKDIPSVFSVDLAEIDVIVKGIKSKEIAKRNIKFVEKYDD